ncbi:hypothetical protein CTAYLR_006257 [Chrysophaeum taylorii]|uniref:Uncharacterized protein n=1 Tax=Chrysophaeum taylorii TaxID=2483200 RepID=A0AAD7UJL8_9STRA|nr:hypothetical protein CTAYLR_006257 [Chrysophaeum taylorii]
MMPTPVPTELSESTTSTSGGLGLGTVAVALIGLAIAVVLFIPVAKFIRVNCSKHPPDLGALGSSAKYDECRGQSYGFIFFATVFNATALVAAVLAASEDVDVVAEFAVAYVYTKKGDLAVGLLGYVFVDSDDNPQEFYAFDDSLPRDDEIDYDYDWRGDCDDAGAAAYGMLVPIILVKLLSCFLVYKRVDPAADAACYKWLAVVVDAAGAVLILAMLLDFSMSCLSKLPSKGDSIFLPVDDDATLIDDISTRDVSRSLPFVCFYLLIFAGILNILTAFIHLRIPTWGAELYSDREQRKQERAKAQLHKKRVQLEKQLKEEQAAVEADDQVATWLAVLRTDQTRDTARMRCDSITVRTIAKALWTNRSLTAIDLSRNGLSDFAGSQVARVLKRNRHLRKIELNENSLGPRTCLAFGVSLKLNSTLECLELESNPLAKDGADASGVVALAKALETNTALTAISLWRCNVGHAAGADLAKALLDNDSITSLDVGNNGFYGSDLRIIADKLEANRQRADDIQREKAAVDVCETLPEPAAGIVSWVGCGPVVYVGSLYLVHEVQLWVRRLEGVYDKDHDGKIDEDTRVGRALARWEVRLLIWATVMFAPLVSLDGAGTALQRYVEDISGRADLVVTLFGSVLKVRRTYMVTLQAISYALKGVLRTISSKSPLATWLAIFPATARPMGLVNPRLVDVVVGLATNPSRELSRLFGSLRARDEKQQPSPPPGSIPFGASLAILLAWLLVGVLLNVDVTISLQDTIKSAIKTLFVKSAIDAAIPDL